MNLAPILLFAYNRPEHTLKTLQALSSNSLAEESILYIFIDGPRSPSTDEFKKKYFQLEEIIRGKKWCKEVIIEKKIENWGLANSIVEGVTRIVKKHGKVIVLEDDTMPLEGFLEFMNSALDFYEVNKEVMHISGYTYPYKYNLCQSSNYFAKILSCWGWATWERAWENYSGDVDFFLDKFGSKERRLKFNIEGHADYFDQLILNKNQVIQSWAVKWYASWLIADGITLFPKKSLIKNIGQDGTGVHGDNTSIFQSETDRNLEFEPVEVVEDLKIRKSIDEFYKNAFQKQRSKINIVNLGLGKLKKVFRRGAKFIIIKLLPELKLAIDQDPIIKNSVISDLARIYSKCRITDASVGDYSYISENAVINKTTFGKFCSVGPNLMCGWGIHPIDGKSTSPMFYSTKKQNGFSVVNYDMIREQKQISIGNDVFIGMNVTILDGVSIGDGAVIGAGAVVSKDIPPYAVAVGNPVKILKFRFNEERIEILSKEKWWDNFELKNPSDLIFKNNKGKKDA